MYLLDTDWIIQALANRQPALRALDGLANSRTYVSYVSVGEVYARAFAFPNPQAHLTEFRFFLSNYRASTLNDSIMERFAEYRAHLRRRGQRIPDFDLLIAATAVHYDLTMLTFNRRHFERLSDLRLYTPD